MILVTNLSLSRQMFSKFLRSSAHNCRDKALKCRDKLSLPSPLFFFDKARNVATMFGCLLKNLSKYFSKTFGKCRNKVQLALSHNC